MCPGMPSSTSALRIVREKRNARIISLGSVEVSQQMDYFSHLERYGKI